LKPLHLRKRNNDPNSVSTGKIGGQDIKDNAFIFDNLGVYEPSPETKAKQRYENSFRAYSRGNVGSSADNF
jgi:hypothetical protein